MRTVFFLLLILTIQFASAQDDDEKIRIKLSEVDEFGSPNLPLPNEDSDSETDSPEKVVAASDDGWFHIIEDYGDEDYHFVGFVSQQPYGCKANSHPLNGVRCDFDLVRYVTPPVNKYYEQCSYKVTPASTNNHNGYTVKATTRADRQFRLEVFAITQPRAGGSWGRFNAEFWWIERNAPAGVRRHFCNVPGDQKQQYSESCGSHISGDRCLYRPNRPWNIGSGLIRKPEAPIISE